MSSNIAFRSIVALSAFMGIANPIAAQDYTWVGANPVWNSALNWTSVAAGFPNSSTAHAIFNGGGVFGVNIGSSVQTQAISFGNSSGNYSITSSAGVVLSGLTNITVGQNVLGVQAINLANVSTGSLLFTGSGPGALTINNHAIDQFILPGGFTIGPNTVIGTPGSGGITVRGDGFTTISGSFTSNPGNAVAGGLTHAGPGQLTLSGNSSALLGGITLAGGTMIWDYATTAASKFGGGHLALQGGQLILRSHATTPVAQTVPSGFTTIDTRGTTIYPQTNSGALANITLNLGSLSRVSTGTLQLILFQSGTSITTTTGLTNGILGPWVVVDGEWATTSGTNIVGLSSYGTDVYSPGTNTNVTVGSGIPSGFTTSTLRFGTPITATLSGVNTIETGGILASGNLPGTTVTGGTLVSGTGEFIVHNYGRLIIDSAMTVTTGMTVGDYSNGVFLSGPINWANGAPLTINTGRVYFTNAQAFAGLTDVHFNNPTFGNQGVYFQLPAGLDANCGAAFRMTGREVQSIGNQSAFINTSTNSRITLSGVLSSESGFSSPLFGGFVENSGFNLTGANSFSGDLRITGAVVGYQTDGNLGNPANALILNELAGSRGGLEFLTNGVSLSRSIRLESAGRVVVTGSNVNSFSGAATGAGSLNKTGTGTLVLSGNANTYSGGTNVQQGRLILGHGDAIPTNTNLTVSSGAEFNTGGFSNTVATRPANVILNGGTFRAPSDGEYHFTNLTMTGGTVDLTGTSNFAMRFNGSGGITATSATGVPAMILGSGASRIQNDTGAMMPITATYSTPFPTQLELDIGAVLHGTGPSSGYLFNGYGRTRITNVANTADMNVVGFSQLQVDDVTTGGFGALGTGAIKLGQQALPQYTGGTLVYGGPTATMTKPLAIEYVAYLRASTNGANLTVTGPITESTPGTLLWFEGPAAYSTVTSSVSSTITVPFNQARTGLTGVYANAILAIPSLPDTGQPSAIGTGTDVFGSPYSISLGVYGNRGTLLLTGTDPQYASNRGIEIGAFPVYGGGGAIGVQNPGTNFTLNGQLLQNFGVATLFKTGPGTLTLTNTANQQGLTIVEQGRLIVPSQSSVIPIGSNVTVHSAAIFQVGPNTDANNAARYGTVALNGGTMQIHPPNPSRYLFINRLVTDASGGTVEVMNTNIGSGLAFTQPGRAITIDGNSTWTGPADFFVLNSNSGELPITIGAGKTVTSDFSLAAPEYPLENYPFRITGGGTLHLTNFARYRADVRVNQARLRMDNLTDVRPDYFRVTLDNGTLAYGGPTQSWPAEFTVGLNGGTVEVINPANTLTLTGAIGNGGGPLIKTGPGTLILDNTSNLYTGGIVVNSGRLDVGNDNQLGQAAITVNPAGTVRFTNSTTTARSYTMFNGSMDVPSGVNLTMNGANVFGGFLRGTGSYVLNGGASLAGVTTFTGTNLNVTGPASISNFAHNGNLTVASGQTLAMNYATNGSAGRMTINGTVNVSEFVSNGLLTVPNGGIINNTGSNMVLGGGSTTFVGAVGNLGGKIDLGGQQLLVRGGLLVTNSGSFGSGNGVRNGQTVADYGALVKGTGPYQSVITQNGGQYLPGNSPGTSQVGDFFINGGGNLIFQITDAGPSLSFPSAPGMAGMNPGWGLTQVFTSMNFTATPASPYTITMQTQLPPPAAPDTPGLMSSFDPNRAYQWLIFDLQPGAVFNGTFDPNAINFAAAQFVNPTLGGTFSLARTGGQIFLTFTPVPEPATVLALAFGGLIVVGAVRHRARSRQPALGMVHSAKP